MCPQRRSCSASVPPIHYIYREVQKLFRQNGQEKWRQGLLSSHVISITFYPSPPLAGAGLVRDSTSAKSADRRGRSCAGPQIMTQPLKNMSNIECPNLLKICRTLSEGRHKTRLLKKYPKNRGGSSKMF